jgi:hypothetical protein
MTIRLIGKVVFVVAVALTAGCKLHVIALKGGEVQSPTGAGTCLEQTICVHDIVDTSFSESFEAVPAFGYEFVKWYSGANFLCRNPTNPVCTVDSSRLRGQSFNAHIKKAEDIFIMPIFKLVDDERCYDAFVTDDSNVSIQCFDQDDTLIREEYIEDSGADHGYVGYVVRTWEWDPSLAEYTSRDRVSWFVYLGTTPDPKDKGVDLSSSSVSLWNVSIHRLFDAQHNPGDRIFYEIEWANLTETPLNSSNQVSHRIAHVLDTDYGDRDEVRTRCHFGPPFDQEESYRSHIEIRNWEQTGISTLPLPESECPTTEDVASISDVELEDGKIYRCHLSGRSFSECFTTQ